MKNKFISFSFLYWIAFVLILIVVSYNDGKEKLSNYSFTEGVVVDKVLIPVRKKRRDYLFSQWQYIVVNDTFLFVDKRYLAYNKPLGTKRPVIYRRDKYDEAMVYNFLFWINFPMIVVAVLIAILIFSIFMFAAHWNDKRWFSRRRY